MTVAERMTADEYLAIEQESRGWELIAGRIDAGGRVPESASPRPYPMPDLAVEVRSPSTWRYDLGTKKAKYEAHGLPELWLVDTKSDTVLAFRRSGREPGRYDVALELGRGERLTSLQMPGFALGLDELFGL